MAGRDHKVISQIENEETHRIDEFILILMHLTVSMCSRHLKCLMKLAFGIHQSYKYENQQVIT